MMPFQAAHECSLRVDSRLGNHPTQLIELGAIRCHRQEIVIEDVIRQGFNEVVARTFSRYLNFHCAEFRSMQFNQF